MQELIIFGLKILLQLLFWFYDEYIKDRYEFKLFKKKEQLSQPENTFIYYKNE
jgi:hypothetical protein